VPQQYAGTVLKEDIMNAVVMPVIVIRKTTNYDISPGFYFFLSIVSNRGISAIRGCIM
jgi:hypothetical protein